ncbi:MAG: thioredoxin TrxC [Chromatiales bacterium]|nr:thioredoxin TrxC [Chromatiales bacterium]
MNAAVHVVCPHCGRTNRVPADRLTAAPVCGACKKPLFTGHPAEVDGAGLKAQVGRSDLPVLVDFWAPWCAPCRMMAPAFAQVAARFEPQLRCLKLNTEDHPEAAAPFGIRGIPTLILFRGGREAARISGALDAGRLADWVRQQL